MEQADSSNLPTVNLSMIAEFIVFSPLFTHSEFRYEKLQHSGRDEYGDIAIGWVQLERIGNVCTVKMQVTPEHNVRSKPYSVTTTINENTRRISKCVCDGCVSSAGGCKHMMSALCWLFRRSNEPPPTSVQCYWRKSVLSEVKTRGLVLEIAKMKGIGKFTQRNPVPNINVYNKWIDHCKHSRMDTQLSNYFVAKDECYQLLILNLLRNLHLLSNSPTFEEFKVHCHNTLNDTLCAKIEVYTREQSKSKVWNKFRFGRITASVVHEASKCTKMNGTLSERILGGLTYKPNKAMKRGLKIEDEVFELLQKRFKNIKKSGLFLNKKYPMFGASPDGIDDEAVFEIKSPISNDNISYYIGKNGHLQPKVMGQINLQMLMTGKTKGFLVIADEKFEENKKISVHEVRFDESLTKSLIKNCEEFYKKGIYPKLLKMI